MIAAVRCRVMWTVLLVCIGGTIVAGEDRGDAASKTDMLVRAALRYELEGSTDFRNIMLRETLNESPDHASANWHSGRILDGETWSTVDNACERNGKDPQLAKYRELRARAEGNLKLQKQLARWCARVGMSERADFHFAQLLLNPTCDPETRAEAQHKLKLHYVAGMLLTEDQLKAHQESADQLQVAMKRWRPRLTKLGKLLGSKNEKQRENADRQLQQIDELTVVPVTETFIASSGPQFGKALVRLVGTFNEHDATPTLVRFAVLSPWPNVRAAATVELKQRPIHDYYPMLLNGLTSPIKSQWRVFQDPAGNVRYRHLLLREGQSENSAVALEHISVPLRTVRTVGEETFETTRRVPRDMQTFDPDDWYDEDARTTTTIRRGLRLRTTDRERMEALQGLLQANEREQHLATFNARASASNQPVFNVLEATSGVVLPRNATDWWLWWEKHNEVVKPKDTRVVYRPTASQYERFTGIRQVENRTTLGRWVYPNHSCFAAGTKVWTETGLMPIEDVRAGDRVYAQDPNSGELSLKLVQRTTAGAPTAPLVKLNIEGEEIRPTLGHVAWVNGKGWRIAKRVGEGDFLHGMHGALEVWATEQQPAPKVVYNLIVDDFHTYFVGEKAVLVHDITYRQPTRALVPGLLPEE